MKKSRTLKIAAAETLQRAAEMVGRPGGWTQRAWARNANGDQVDHSDPGAVSFCPSGAISRACHDVGSYDALELAYGALLRHVRGALVSTWNDSPERTQADVVHALTIAAGGIAP